VLLNIELGEHFPRNVLIPTSSLLIAPYVKSTRRRRLDCVSIFSVIGPSTEEFIFLMPTFHPSSAACKKNNTQNRFTPTMQKCRDKRSKIDGCQRVWF